MRLRRRDNVITFAVINKYIIKAIADIVYFYIFAYTLHNAHNIT